MTQKRSVSTSLRSFRRSARLNRDNEKRLRADMVQRRHLLKYIGLILPFRKSISHISFFARKSRTGNRRLSLPLVRLLFLRTARPPSRGYSIIPAQDCQAWLSRRGASGSQTVGPVAISALGDNDILCDQFIQIIPCA